MKPIPETFTANGFIHELVERTGDVAIFRRFKMGGGREHFETVVINRHNGFSIAGKDITPAETYPPAQQWGVRGWTFLDKDAAKAKMSDLLSKTSATPILGTSEWHK